MEIEKKRYYRAHSHIYGMTVYDRTTQTPAFEVGATENMNEFDAIRLCNKLNREEKRKEREIEHD